MFWFTAVCVVLVVAMVGMIAHCERVDEQRRADREE